MFYLFLFLLTAHVPSSQLHFSIAPQQGSYHQGEPIVFSLTVANHGKWPVMLDKRFLPEADESFGGELTFLVSDAHERLYPFLPATQSSSVLAADVQQVPPKHEIVKTLSLSDFYTLNEPGTYLVQAVYDTTQVQANVPIWRGRLISAPVTVEIVPK